MKITPIIASTFLSDGGTMFGLVPRGIWSKRIPPDDRNRIPQHAHSLLVELDDGRRGLVDTGCGASEKFSAKELDMNGLGPGWPLVDALARLGLEPGQIDFVALTHLHWDHAGGASTLAGSTRRPTFPNAQHFIHELEWEDATSGNVLLYKSYPAEMIEPLKLLPDSKRVLVTDRDNTIAPGFRLMRSSGHTRGHCIALLEADRIQLSGVDTSLAIFAGDVCPTRHHLRMVFQTSYDTYPLDTRAWKRKWLPRIAQKNGWLLFDHDPNVFGVTIREDEREEFLVVNSLPAES